MKKNIIKKIIVATVSVAMVGGLLAGCGSKNNASNSGTNNGGNSGDSQIISGSITTLGSSALQPLAEATAKTFMEKNKNVTINVQGGGSGAGIKAVVEGTAEIGNSDVLADTQVDANIVKDLVDHEVCGIGFAMVVSKDVTVESLTKDQIQKIFKGEITNWKEVGGNDAPINLIHRKTSSGTRATFIETLMDGQEENAELGTTQPESGGVRDAIKVTDGAISYLSMSYLTEDVKKDVKVIKIDNVEPTDENIIGGQYPFWSYGHMYTKGEAQGTAKAYLDYMVSDENAENVQALGYIPMSKFSK